MEAIRLCEECGVGAVSKWSAKRCSACASAAMGGAHALKAESLAELAAMARLEKAHAAADRAERAFRASSLPGVVREGALTGGARAAKWRSGGLSSE